MTCGPRTPSNVVIPRIVLSATALGPRHGAAAIVCGHHGRGGRVAIASPGRAALKYCSASARVQNPWKTAEGSMKLWSSPRLST